MIRPRTPQPPDAVAAHYDELDLFYREVWGEHVHHGTWETGRESPARAVAALVELVAARLDLAPGLAVCDIGCGYGATAQMLAEAHGAAVTGVTISAAQHARARRRVPARGVLVFRRQDWLENDFPGEHFDRACAIESSEHMADKQLFCDEAFRTLRPGGRFVICAWLSRTAPPAWQVRHLLEPICREGRLPGLGDEADYTDLLARAGFELLGVEDISRSVARTWSVCLRRIMWKLASDRRYLRFLRDRTKRERVFALTMLRLLAAYRTGALRYCVLTARRPG